MTWVKLDDQFPSHPKMVLAGGDAAWLHVCALCYCGQHLTDGRFPKAIVGRLSDRKKPLELATRLVEVGAWDDLGDEYEIHDYLEHNPSRAQVLEERAKRSAAGKRGAEKRWHSDSTGHSNSYGAPHNDRIDNVDAPGPSPIKDIPAADAAEPFTADFDEWWDRYPRKLDKAQARKAYIARRRSDVSADDLLAALHHYNSHTIGAELKHVKYPATFLNGYDGPWSEWVNGPPETPDVVATIPFAIGPKTPTRVLEDGTVEKFYQGAGWMASA
jgi:hypothetical protein